jgi:hypothetical protein
VKIVAASSRFVFLRPHAIFFHLFSDGVAVYDESDGSVCALVHVAGEVLGICKQSVVVKVEDVSSLLGLDSPTEEELGGLMAMLGQFESMGFLERVAA